MQELRYCSCNTDPDLWMKAQYRPEWMLKYLSYIVCCLDDILCIHHDQNDVLNKLNGFVPLKPGSVGSPDMYFGMKHKCMQLHNGIWAWFISPYKFVQEAVRIWEEYLCSFM